VTEDQDMETHMRRISKQCFTATILMVLLSVITAGYGVSNSAAAITSSAKSSSLGGAAIKIGLIGTFETSNLGFAFPQVQGLVKAVVKQVNETGGIDGRPLSLWICNDGADPNIAAACGRSAVTQGVVAVIGGESQNATQVLPFLQAAGIAFVGNPMLSPADGSSSVAFPSDGGAVTAGAGVAVAAVDSGCKKLGIVAIDYSAAVAGANTVKAGMQALGGSANILQVPLAGEPSYSAQVAELQGANDQCASLFAGPTEIPKFAQAIRSSGAQLPFILPYIEGGAAVQTMGSLANGILESNDFALPLKSDPNTAAFRAWQAKYDSGATLIPEDYTTYMGAVLLEAALHKVVTGGGSVTAKTVLDALGTLGNVQTGLAAVSPDKPFPVAAYRRLFLTSIGVYVFRNGSPSLKYPFKNERKLILQLTRTSTG
jgi:ABC-type branched-subunit amino acid transport system substrate-binding protein